MSSSSSSPCAACKLRRQKCAQECIFAPYFPPDQPKKFANVHEVFGASNVAKILNELNPAHREDAVNSLAYEAEARLQNPVYGCVGFISILQHKLKQVQYELYHSKNELAKYAGPSAMLPVFDPGLIQQQQTVNMGGVLQCNMQQMMGLQQENQMMMMIQQSQQQNQMVDQAQQQQQGEDVAFGNGFNQTMEGGDLSAFLALGTYDNNIDYQQIQQQQQMLVQQRGASEEEEEEAARNLGPSL